MEKAIKDVYNCDQLNGNDPLVLWYNQVIEKNIDELSTADVARCIRQSLFLEIAYRKLIVFLLHDPYEGDVYEGEFMEKAADMNQDFMVKYTDSLLKIIQNARRFIETFDWECDEDKEEYEETVNKVSKKIKNVCTN